MKDELKAYILANSRILFADFEYFFFDELSDRFKPDGWFVYLLAAKGSKTMPVLSTVEAQLSLHKRNIAKAVPEARDWQ